MSDQKNIDNLFRDSFKDFEASPDPALWDKISDKLDAKEAEKKKEGIVFLPWLYKAAGIAAAIVLLFFVGNEFINSDGTGIDSDEQTTSTTKSDSLDKDANRTTTNSEITDTGSEQNSSNNKNNSSSNGTLTNQERIANENGVDNNGIQQKDGSGHNVQEGNALQNAVAQENGTTTNSQQSLNSNRNTNTEQNKNIATQENAVAIRNSTQNNNATSNNTSQNGVNANDRHANTVAQQNNNTNSTTNAVQNGTNTSGSNNTNSNTTIASNSSAVAQNDASNTANASNNNKTTNSTTIDTAANTDETNTETAVAEVKKDDEIKKSLLDVINDLHDLEKNNTDVAETKLKRWSISPNASPVYYNTLSNGSPIDETFADNTKTGDVNFSYGLNVGYDVSKRLTIRSGIHKVDYSYSTKDIALVPSINGTDLTTIAFKTNGASFDIQDRQAPSNIVYSQYQLPSSESSIRQKQIEGDLSQRMSYIEVPVELKYAVLDKKLGINVIGGVSTLVLTENSIILDSPELLTEIGEATNVNNVSFSTNIGVGIDYKVSKQIEFNLEPMLKYQLNTFSGNTGNFKPYSVGVYTGVSFRF